MVGINSCLSHTPKFIRTNIQSTFLIEIITIYYLSNSNTSIIKY